MNTFLKARCYTWKDLVSSVPFVIPNIAASGNRNLRRASNDTFGKFYVALLLKAAHGSNPPQTALNAFGVIDVLNSFS